MIRRFRLFRSQLTDGHPSTLGYIAEGASFSDGQVVLRWLTAGEAVAIYPSLDRMMKMHGVGVEVRWIDAADGNRVAP